MLLENKTIIVTGAASGIGAETAGVIQQQGGRVIAVDIMEPAIAVDQFYQADLGEPGAIDDLIRALPRGADGLCNIAGLPPTRPAPQVLRVNLVGLKYLTLGLVDKLADGAAIVNAASLAGIGWPDAIDAIKDSTLLTFDDVEDFCERHDIVGARSYFFTKEALIVWTMQNRWTWRDRGIRMNCVSPGPVETPILKDFIETLGDRVEEDMRVMDRPGRPADIAPLIAFLCSDGSGWIRGTNIPVDGGMYSHIQCETHGLL